MLYSNNETTGFGL